MLRAEVLPATLLKNMIDRPTPVFSSLVARQFSHPPKPEKYRLLELRVLTVVQLFGSLLALRWNVAMWAL